MHNVFEYIDNHLDGELNLETISTIACYSPFHFHRIFKSITYETLNSYLTRRRIEKAAAQLIHQQEASITSISFRFGYSSNAAFTKAFKKFYGVSPSVFRKEAPDRYRKINHEKRKNGQVQLSFADYIWNFKQLKEWIIMNAKIEIKEMPSVNIACITSIGSAGLTNAYEKLSQWAAANKVDEQPTFNMITVYHDSYKITAPEKVRMSACITVKEPIKTSDPSIGFTTIEKGKHIVASFVIGIDEFEKSWTGLFIWMNENGYKKADRNPFEVYHNDFRKHPEKKCIVDFCIPVA